ncbi:MAG TPA: HPF/RaiA family ribosome-associated protein [Candidatus Saccharimonadales bacterium]|nr:HPF/RaiA family ribosome-associated protein [Candidatus Saccharimonadales bacterium]
MEADMTFRGMEPSHTIEQYAAKYLTKFKKYLGKEESDSVFVSVVFEGEFNHHMYACEVRIKTPHFDVQVKKEGHDMYPLIDETMKVVEQDLQNKKQRIVDDLRKRKKLV